MELQHVVYGEKTIPFALAFKPRKTLAIEVFPDQSVQVIAPVGTSAEEIKSRVRNRAAWILRQQRYFASFVAQELTKEYVSGESFRYLGRQYRLKVVEAENGKKEEVKLSGGYIRVFTLSRQDRTRTECLVANWYRIRARVKLRERFQRCCEKIQRYGIPPPCMEVRRMTHRWGSCTPSRRVLLNTQLAQAPVYCIDYVIFHELCHLKFNNHNKNFYKLLHSVFPEWEIAKKRLARIQEF